jgi:ankyrin repeat protein
MSLWAAAREGDLGEIERLVGQDRGLLDVIEEASGWTPLILASWEGRVKVVRYLLDEGVEVNKPEGPAGPVKGRTALYLAAERGCTSVVRLLVKRGADPARANVFGWSPLIVACREGHSGIVRFLLAHPSAAAALINRRTNHGRTALWYACERGYRDIVRALLEAGADPTIADNEGITPRAIAEETPPYLYQPSLRGEGRRRCAAALKVRCSGFLRLPSPCCG